MTRRDRHGFTSGYTLTEILAVLSIVSLLATLAVPPLQAYIRRLDFRACLRQTSQLLRQGQVLSQKSYLAHRLVIQNDTLRLQRKEDGSWSNTRYSYRPKAKIRVSLNQNPIFYPSGAIVPLCKIIISQPAKQYSLTISAAGRIRIQHVQ